MSTTVRLWEVMDDKLKAIEPLKFDPLEAHLESWICENADILGGDVLIIDRQRKIPEVGQLDLLGIDQDGKLVVIELKRDSTAREAVAQALDYASWLHSESEDRIKLYAQQHLGQSLDKAFFERFGENLPEFTCQAHRIILVAPSLDSSAERIVTYLANRYGMEISAVSFTYAKLTDGRQVLARSVLVESGSRTQSTPVTAEELLAKAEARGTTALVEICRQMGQFWEETCYRTTFEGAFRYWAKAEAGKSRMVFGVNVGAYRDPPQGQLDIWIPTKKLSEATGLPAEDIQAVLRDGYPVVDAGVTDYWIRLPDESVAARLVSQLIDWQSGKAAAAKA